jgi:hypothetical protein
VGEQNGDGEHLHLSQMRLKKEGNNWNEMWKEGLICFAITKQRHSHLQIVMEKSHWK